ncbi:MAG: membrane protein insertase YidC [Deltaproteobacteria bacterium]|nr:membrane protein insertase YidC [Deltaproteobacteria bacterium]
MDNNRTILAVVLIVLLWSGYSLFFTPQQQTIPPAQDKVVVAPDNQPSKELEKAGVSNSAVSTPVTKPMLDIGAEETRISVVSDYFEIELTSLGATLHSVDLKNYKKTNDVNSEDFHLFSDKDTGLSTFITTGSDGFYIPSNLNFEIISNKSDVVYVTNESATISFAATINDLTIVKNYTFYPSSYSFDLNIELTNNSANIINGKLNLSLITPWNKDAKAEMYSFIGPISYDGEDLLQDKIKDLEGSPKVYSKNILWSGYTSKYFLTAINPKDSSEQIFIQLGDNFIENKFISPTINLLSNKSEKFEYSAYFGPKQIEFLAASHNSFESTIHYGFFHPLAKPLMVVLKFFYDFIGNYGFAIVLLTICIKIIFWPLTQKSYKSMKGMQKLQPEMKKMREKYGADKQKLNQEMMAFYKENKVNPLGGCLPMVIQIPVFFALYRVLLGSIELRHAPFMLWITDLSAKDPYYVTPLIMGVTMFLQQKMTPTNMDPTQEKIMLMMPVVFTFMFLNFPSGLVIYWLTNNVLTILQQYLIRRQPD